MLNPVATATNNHAPALTMEMLEASFARLKSKVGFQGDSLYDQYARALSARTKARYARYLGVDTLSAAQEQEMWDGMSRAWARRLGIEDAEGNLL